MKEREKGRESPQFIQCPYGCGANIPIGKNNEQALDNHLKTCPNKPQNTAFKRTPDK